MLWFLHILMSEGLTVRALVLSVSATKGCANELSRRLKHVSPSSHSHHINLRAAKKCRMGAVAWGFWPLVGLRFPWANAAC